MALKASGSKGATKKAGSENKEALKKIAKDGVKSTGMLMHNLLIGVVFILAMALVCIIATELSFMLAGFVVGGSMTGSGDTYSSLIVTFVTVAMVCGFALFFAFKIENALFAGMRSRLWHKDPMTGEIIKDARGKRQDGDKDDK